MRNLPESGRIGREDWAAIVAAGRPLVLREQVADWPAVAAARRGEIVDHLRAAAGERPAPCVVGVPAIRGRFFYRADMRGMNFGRREAPLGELLDQLVEQAAAAEPLTLAMQSAPTDVVLPGFAEDNPLPLLDAHVRPRIWVGNRVAVATHYDSNDNVACVVAGRRRFTLFPPDQVANLYVGPLEVTPAGTPVSMVDVDAPDFVRYPRFAEALEHGLTAELEPGDAIFIPYLWWHAVRSLDPVSVLVNYWWSDRAEPLSPVDALLHALAAMRALPPSRRAAWRALFDHLIFDDAATHLPDDARGVLGDLDETSRRGIATHLARQLGKPA
ncbi:cupin-like domain-containing protein [Sphingomonas sp. KR1UV-12]|uniref:Cupin-like domain-containing protein n=1 Tax=Sphingomonas aurea TaxID=3063994 RepID=A0ABT9EIR9_9SPHN|nr:cupin-like domain-containing protein [Sphingomonas sp. KR1UV-12]MDP1026735.1 cupin-like domain-containing protein [Sphingomonas sp. KR1UV-12]